MILSDKAKDAITTKTKNRLALALNCSVYTVDRWLKDNEENGDLSKSISVQIIAEETGLQDTEILQESTVTHPG